MTNLSTTTRPHAHGFTVMELIVVIAIIAALMAILVGGMTVLRGGAQEAQTQTLLAGLMGLEGQYQVQFKGGFGVKHLVDPYDPKPTYDWTTVKRQNAEGYSNNVVISGDYVNPETSGDYTYSNGDTNDDYMKSANLFMERFLWAVNQMPVIREKLPSFGASFGDSDTDGFIDIVDAWGNPIAYANMVTHTPGKDEADDFLPEYRGPFFASAGQDGMWGRPRNSGEFSSDAAWNAYKETDDYRFSIDNLYSFDVDRSAAQRGD